MSMIFGCIPVVPTFFDENNQVDLDALDKCLSYLDSFDFEAYWILGTGGEDMSLTNSERYIIYDHLSSHYLSRRMIIGCGSYSLKQSVEDVKYISKLDVFKGIHYMPYNKLISDDLIVHHYEELASNTSLDVYAYSSANWSKPFSFDLLRTLKENKSIVGIKYSTSNIVQTCQALSLQDDSFQIIPAVVKQLVPSLSMGAIAFTTVEAILFPKIINEIYILCAMEKNYEKAKTLQFKLNHAISSSKSLCSQHNFLRLAEIKLELEKTGICKRYMSYGYFDYAA